MGDLNTIGIRQRSERKDEIRGWYIIILHRYSEIHVGWREELFKQ